MDEGQCHLHGRGLAEQWRGKEKVRSRELPVSPSLGTLGVPEVWNCGTWQGEGLQSLGKMLSMPERGH